METACLAILSSKGQLTVPRQIREKLDFEKGQKLLLEIMEKTLVVKKATIQVEENLEAEEWEELKKLASHKGKTYKTGKSFLHSLKAK